MNEIVQKTIRNLNQHNMAGYYVYSVAELHDIIRSLIREGETIGCGDSVTLEQTGVFDLIRCGHYEFLDKHKPGLSSEEKRELYLKNFWADTFLTGVNAVTTDGNLFNIDGNGSRVAPILYGPQQVIVVAGTNKIAASLDEAILHARQIAAPLDAKRLGKNTPCTKIGTCIDCSHQERICNDFVLITGQFKPNRIKVIFIEGNHGF